MFYLRCLGAIFYDAIILSGLFIIVTAICLIFRHGAAIAPHTLWYRLVLISIVILYYGFSYQKGGQTIGMKAWHLKVISKDSRLTKLQILGRFLLAPFALVFGVLRLQNPLRVLNQWTKSEVIYS